MAEPSMPELSEWLQLMLAEIERKRDEQQRERSDASITPAPPAGQGGQSPRRERAP